MVYAVWSAMGKHGGGYAKYAVCISVAGEPLGGTTVQSHIFSVRFALKEYRLVFYGNICDQFITNIRICFYPPCTLRTFRVFVMEDVCVCFRAMFVEETCHLHTSCTNAYTSPKCK